MQAATGTGRVIAGRYELVDRVGRGAMGTVWRARDLVLAREVAVKEVRVPGVMSEQDRQVRYERTLREARAAGRLSHPGAVTVYDVIETDGSPWIVMELVPSRSLDRVLAEDGPLSPQRTAQIGMILLEVLASAHSAGIVHRDVKPANVLLTEGRRVVLTDFGIATLAGEPGLTQAGMVMGTPGFCAPERIRGEPASPASDLWSLGATLYAAVEGQGPFHSEDSPMAVMTDIVHSEPPAPRLAGPLGPAISALLEKDPHRRPGAAAAGRLLASAASVTLPQATAGAAVAAGTAAEGVRVPVPSPPVAGVTAAPHPAPPVPALLGPPALSPGPGRPGRVQPVPAGPPALADPLGSRTATEVNAPALPRGDGPPAGHARPAECTRHRQPRGRAARGPRTVHRRLLVAALGGAVLLGAGLLAAAMLSHPRPTAHRRPGASHPASGGVAKLPAGYHWYSTPGVPAGATPGFSVAVPDGWQVRHLGGTTQLNDPFTGGSITIAAARTGSAQPLRDVRVLARRALRRARYRGYHEISIDGFMLHGRLAGAWRFSYRPRGTSRMDSLQVIARVGPSGQAYELGVTAPVTGWVTTRAAFGEAMLTLRPYS